MGILEIHFHDSQFEWTVNPGTGEERSLPLGVGSGSEETMTDGGQSPSSGRSRPSVVPKLKMVGVLGLVVGAAAAYNRVQSRRAQQMRDAEESSSGGRLSPFLSR